MAVAGGIGVLLVVAAVWITYRLQVRFFLPVALVVDWLLIWGLFRFWQAADRFRYGIVADDELELQAGAQRSSKVAVSCFNMWFLDLA